jgi:hypothetical protein
VCRCVDKQVGQQAADCLQSADHTELRSICCIVGGTSCTGGTGGTGGTAGHIPVQGTPPVQLPPAAVPHPMATTSAAEVRVCHNKGGFFSVHVLPMRAFVNVLVMQPAHVCP